MLAQSIALGKEEGGLESGLPSEISSYRICTRCVMDTTDSEIQFDEKGECNHCRDHEKKLQTLPWDPEVRKQKLDLLVQEIKAHGKGKAYDCIVGVSGGLDSTYVCYIIKKLGLRALAVHVDNGWNSELAVQNIERFLKKLDMDLYTHVLDWEEFKDLQLSFLKSSVVDCEVPTDHALNAGLFHIANERGIKHIITGTNYVTEGLMPKSWACNKLDTRFINAIHDKFGHVPLKTFHQLTPLRYIYFAYLRGIHRVGILSYVDYDKKKVLEILARELGYRYYAEKHYESIYTRFYQGYILPKKFGYDKRRPHLSVLICSGQMTRAEALEELKRGTYPSEEMLEEDKEFVYKKLGLTEKEFDDIMNLPPKKSTEYPSYQKILGMRKTAKRFFVNYLKIGPVR